MFVPCCYIFLELVFSHLVLALQTVLHLVNKMASIWNYHKNSKEQNISALLLLFIFPKMGTINNCTEKYIFPTYNYKLV